ncbi:hypothetical protein V6N11_014429 [Hibiscus sabdariffa]|uniref:RNase H type-1 domain-containing protein n=1 Tax=Hibiscus sabdariffa TaxID=183260 RepID=A0ABR2ADZ1_9ROSI
MSGTVSPAKFGDFVSANLQERLVAILKTPNSYGIHDDKWPIRFAVVCWQLWKSEDHRRMSMNTVGKGVLVNVRFGLLSCGRSMICCITFGILDTRNQWWNQTVFREWDVVIRHVGRMANSVADDLACLYHGAPVGTVLFQEPPLVVVAALSKDFSSLA